MNPQIIALRCPSCGNSTDTRSKDARFGLRLTCGYCHTESVLVLNQQLYIPKTAEHVCLQCGAVALPNARFCQCGASMVRQCFRCEQEFPVDHAICDNCGWRADLGPESAEALGDARTRTRAVKSRINTMVELACRGADVSEKIREIIVLLDSEISCGNDIEADYYLSLLLQNVPRLRDAGVEFLGPKFFGSNAVAAVRAILPHIARFYDVEFRRLETAIDLLVLLGPEAVREVPEVMQRMLWKILPLSLCEGQKIPEWSMSKDSFYELLGFFGPAAIVVVPMLIEKLQQPYARAAARALVAIGDVAIPQLQSLITSTFWSRSRDPDLENKSKRIISAIKGHRLADPFWDL